MLALAHDATRTGAPGVLLSLLQWLDVEREVEIQTVLRRGGPLVDDFAAVGPVRALRPWGRRGPADAVEAGLLAVGRSGLAGRVTPAEARLRNRGRLTADQVVINGLGAAALLAAVDPDARCAVIVHEMRTAMSRAATPRDRDRLWERAERVVAVSQRVAVDLVEDQGVDEARIVVANEFVPDRVDRLDREAARIRLGVDPDAVVVAAVGSGAWRKGVDLFVAVAARVHRSVADRVRFVWVGPVDHEDEVRHDMASLGVEDVVDLVGPTADTDPWFDAMDVLVLTSREDPFPLVVLEAGLAEVPVVSFANGGAVEVLEPDAGVVVPYLDVDAMADAVVALVGDPDHRSALGAELGRRVRRDHVTRAGAPRMWEALTRP